METNWVLTLWEGKGKREALWRDSPNHSKDSRIAGDDRWQHFRTPANDSAWCLKLPQDNLFMLWIAEVNSAVTEPFGARSWMNPSQMPGRKFVRFFFQSTLLFWSCLNIMFFFFFYVGSFLLEKKKNKSFNWLWILQESATETHWSLTERHLSI